MDIREFYKSQSQNQNANNASTTPNSTNDFSEYTDTINKYKDLPQEELYNELFSQASNLKAEGKLNTQMLEQISSTLTPMLNEEQQELLKNLMQKLK